MPPEILAALESQGLKSAYDARPPYQRNDYLGWIGRARRDETRIRRLEQMLAELKAGDRYMKMSYRAAQLGPLLLAACTIVGCSGSDPDIRFRTRVVDTFTPVEGAASTFEPLVAHSEATPRCERLTNLPPALGHSSLSFIYGDPQHQRIVVVFDEEGTPIQYSDGRGDLIASDETVGDATTISLDLTIGQAIAFNHPAGREVEAMRFPFDEALESEALGRPAAMMARLLTTCGES